MQREFINHLEKDLNLKILDVTQIYGGCINQSFKIETRDANYFVKINSDSNLFDTEEKGLITLSSTNTFFIPEVVTYNRFEDTYYLIIEFVESSHPKNDFWQLFGQKLSELHRNTKDTFGLEYNNYIGSLPQNNTLNSDGIDFFINSRILPQLKMLDQGLSINMYSKFDRLISLLPSLLPLEQSSLLHGDLWNGNYLVSNKGEPTLIDPSIYYGSREVDIAMTKLFGGFPKEFYDAYNSNFPMIEKWEDRIDIWNLYPLLVHANLFGNSYIKQIQFILDKYN